MSSTRDALVVEVSPPVEVSGNKVTVVGVGQVGMACAFSILTQVREFQTNSKLSLPTKTIF